MHSEAPEASGNSMEVAIREGSPLMGTQRKSSQKGGTLSSRVEPMEQEAAALEVGSHRLEQCTQ